MRKEKVSISIYRHYNGGYFMVNSVAKDPFGKIGDCVIYTSLNSGETFMLDLEDFCSKVPPDSDLENVTGQLYKFCRVDKFGDVLSNASTENLVKELSHRSDNPFAGFCSDSVFQEEFCVGRIINEYDYTTEKSIEDFEVFYVTDDLQKAKEKLLKYKSSIIMRRLWVLLT